MDIDIGLDPVGTLDSVFDFSGNQAARDRQIYNQEQNNKFQREAYWNDYFFRIGERDWNRERQTNALQNLVKDAKAAGIGPLAALGHRGATPINAGFPTAPRFSNQNFSGQRTMTGLTQMSARLAVIGQAADTVKQIKEINPSGQNVTTYPLQTKQPVEHSESMYRQTDKRPPSVHYVKGPDGQDMPVSTVEFEEVLFGLFLESLDDYQRKEGNRSMWDELRKRPDKTGRFGYLKGGDTIAP